MDIKIYGNDVEKALRILKLQRQKEGLFKDLKKRRFYEKPSEKKTETKRGKKKKNEGSEI